MFSLLTALAMVANAVAAPVYPVKPSANGRYLVDQTSAPFLMIGDSPQALIVNLTEADAALYFTNRSARGFNTLWINLLCTTYTAGRADASTIDGILPFTGKIASTTSYDLSTINEAYFAHVDRIINLAAQQGLNVLLDPIETGGFLQTMLDNGTVKCRAYGQYLGNRYKNCPNILWMSGNDFQNWRDASSDAVVRAVALGIMGADTNHLHTVELDYLVSSSLDNSNWGPIVGLNAVYTYYPTYAEVLHAYSQSSFTPVFMVEANYEFEHNPATDGGTTQNLRRQEYWTQLSGAAGQLYGSKYTWPFPSGWQANLDTPGAIQLGYVKALFEPRAWYGLIPDILHTVVTAGYGTFATSGGLSANDYATAARTADGTLVLAYMPTIRTVTVDLSQLSGAATAQWYDPANGTYLPITGSPFPNAGSHNFIPPGNNNGGDGDWVLVLDSAASSLQIVTSSLSQGTVGADYSSQLQAIGGSQPYSWSLAPASPPLPPGLSLSTDGLLSGVPATVGVFNLIVQVVDSTNAVATQSLAIAIVLSDTSAPTIPSGATATAASSSQVNLSWTASTDNVGVTGYLVERSQGAGSTAFVQVGTVTPTNYPDTGLSAGTVYNYRVRAADAAGNLSGYSSVASATTTSNAPSGGLVAAYAFNEGTGTTVTAASGNGITGTISGATWTTAGRYGNALSFNGTSSYVNLGNPTALKLTGSMTLEAWVMATGNPVDDGQIIAKSAAFGWQFKTSPDTGVRTFAVGVSANSSTLVQRYSKTVLSLNTWYHVAGVYNASAQTLDIYVNGVLDDGVLSGTVPATQFDPSQNVLIGKRSDGFLFKGTIDETRIYNRALSAGEIQSDMNAAIGSSSPADTTPPSVPTSLRARAVSRSQINLSWTASTDNVGVAAYLIERRRGSGSYGQIGTTTVTTFNDTGLLRNASYGYRVRAADAAGNLSSYSNVASATPR